MDKNKLNSRPNFKKYLNIITTTDSYNYTDFDNSINIYKNEYKNIMLNHKISPKEFDKAIRVICTHLAQSESKFIKVDLNIYDENLKPPKEMTIEEIEAALGYKIKIIN